MDYNNNQNNQNANDGQNINYQQNDVQQGTYQQGSYQQGSYQQNTYQQNTYQAGPQQPHYSSQSSFTTGQGNTYSNPGMDYSSQYSSPYDQPVQKPGPNACQIISLILGILSIICCCFGIVSTIMAVVGIVLAIIGNKNHKHGVGTGGLVCSIVGLILSLIILGLSALGTYIIPDSLNDLYQTLERYENYY